jgi:hypothetical protein
MRKLTLSLLACGALLALALPRAAFARDRDHDGLPDRWERRHHLSTARGSANQDPDRDRIDNGNEFRERTNPRDRDTDGDRRPDGREDADHDRLSNRAEDATANDPRDRDTDDDGVADGREHAGVVVSLVDGVLTLDLANGNSLRGQATDETEIECTTERAEERRHRRRGRHRGRGKGATRKAQLEEGGDHELDPDVDEPDAELEDDPGAGDEDSAEDADEDFDEVDEDEGEHEGRSCSASALQPGVGVHEAELELTAEGLVFESLELLR